MNLLRTIRFSLFVVVIVAILSLTLPVGTSYSQAVIKKILITDLDYTHFPEMITRVRVLDEGGLPYKGLTNRDLLVKEDGQEADAIVLPEQVGIKTALVFDAGAGVNSRGATGVQRFEEMKAAAQKFIDTMGPGDAAELILVRPEGVSVLQPLTGDKEVLINVLSNLKVENTGSLSQGLLGVDKALTDLRNSSGDETAMAVLLLSSNIQSGRDFDKIEKSARDIGIPLHTIMFNASQNQILGLDRLAANTGGEFIFYTSPTVLDKLYKRLDDERDQYQISYRSPSSTASQRILTVGANSDAPDAPQDSYPFAVRPAPQLPSITTFQVNNGDPIMRKSVDGDTDPTTFDPTETKVQVGFGWNDEYGARKIRWVELLVDGNVEGQKIQSPGKSVIFPWNMKSYVDNGKKTVKLSVRGEDEFGMAFSSDSFPVTVEVNNIDPTPTPTSTPTSACNNLSGIQSAMCKVKIGAKGNITDLIAIGIALIHS